MKKNPYTSKYYADYEWDDETSQSDPKGVWMGGSEYYSRRYACRVPRAMLKKAEKSGDFDAVHDWIASHDGIREIWLE